MATIYRKKLGQILIDAGLITEKILEESLKKAAATGARIGEVLVSEGYLTEDSIAKALGEQYGIPYIGESLLNAERHFVERIPAELAYKLNAIPIYETPQEVTIAIVDPLDILVMDELKKLFKKRIKTVVTTEKLMKQALDKFFTTKGEDLDKVLKQIDIKAYEIKGQEESPERLMRLAEEAPIVQIVNGILIQAVNDRASDIHLEAAGKKLRVRFRIDGKLHDIAELPRALLNPIISRIKIMSDMDISEKRLPQDGHMQMEIGLQEGRYQLIRTFVGRAVLRHGQEDMVDVRVSTAPTVQGEKAVLRLLRKRDELLNLENLNMQKDMVVKLRKLLNRAYGMLLISGPTGAGKTTTAYACLKHVHKNENNIITIEDPVEYQFMGVNQIQVNPKIGLTFSNTLRSILRQDPDIILVGEIRDKETAEIATHASLTGHLVISTIHTNNAIATIARLQDMGIEPYLISSSISGIVAQRLLRKICPYCKKDYVPPESLLTELKLPPFAKFYRGTGCSKCHETGYMDRVGVYELLIFTDNIKEMILAKASSKEIGEVAEKEGFVSLINAGIRLVLDGVTTIEEVVSATFEEVI